MFSLFESCKLNDINFGDYIEDIHTRLMEGEQDFMSLIPCNYSSNKKVNVKAAILTCILCGEEVDASFLPCDYVRHFEDDTNTEVTKTFQAVVTTQHPYRKLLVNKA